MGIGYSPESMVSLSGRSGHRVRLAPCCSEAFQLPITVFTVFNSILGRIEVDLMFTTSLNAVVCPKEANAICLTTDKL